MAQQLMGEGVTVVAVSLCFTYDEAARPNGWKVRVTALDGEELVQRSRLYPMTMAGEIAALDDSRIEAQAAGVERVVWPEVMNRLGMGRLVPYPELHPLHAKGWPVDLAGDVKDPEIDLLAVTFPTTGHPAGYEVTVSVGGEKIGAYRYPPGQLIQALYHALLEAEQAKRALYIGAPVVPSLRSRLEGRGELWFGTKQAWEAAQPVEALGDPDLDAVEPWDVEQQEQEAQAAALQAGLDLQTSKGEELRQAAEARAYQAATARREETVDGR